MTLMTSVCGNRKNFQDLGKFLAEYNLQNKKIIEFTELDKMVYLRIKHFVKLI